MKTEISMMMVKIHVSPKLFTAASPVLELFCLELVCGSGWWVLVVGAGGYWW